MGFIFEPSTGRPKRSAASSEIMSKHEGGDLENSLPFAMEPVVYDFSINESGHRRPSFAHRHRTR